ncbi:MAG TPA: FAD:protein FMN transferase [Pyrinomonadaceae bacterium]
MAYNRRRFLNLISRSEPRVDDCWLHVNRTAMACRFEVTLPASEERGIAVATEALDEVDRLEARLTVFRESSEVSYVNAHAAAGPVKISEPLFNLLVQCKELSEETGGAFDITSGPLTRCWGFLRREGRVPTKDEIEAARSVIGSHNLILDHSASTIQFATPGVEINLGSIGKGYALDCAGDLLANSLHSALFNAGASSMRAIGAGEHGAGWTVGLRHPHLKFRRLGVLRLRDCALSTSGNEEQFFEHEGHRFSHIIDPRSGWPGESVTSVSVVAKTGALSDALATAFFVGGRALAEEYCATHGDVFVVMLESGAQQPITIGKIRTAGVLACLS